MAVINFGPWWPKIVGGLLWLVSASLTAMLFLTFADGDLLRSVVLILLALGLEGAKILKWRAGGGQRLLAWLLIGLSCLASFGAALQTVRLMDASLVVQTRLSQGEEHLLRDLEGQIQALNHRLEQLPPDWVTSYRNLASDLAQLQDKRGRILEKLTLNRQGQTGSGVSKSLFQELADFFGLEKKHLELATLLLLALCLEWGALSLLGNKTTSRAPTSKSRKQPRFDPNKSEAFLAKLIELGNGTFLGGRDRAGLAIGLGFAESKLHLQYLLKTGRIKKSGKRMILTDVN